MFDVDDYLRRIGCPGETSRDIATLRKLHKGHLMAIPYNGAGDDLGDDVRFVDVDEGAIYETSVINGQGGSCFQLNRLFYRLLQELGYDVTLMAAVTAEGRENIGVEAEHMFSRVALDSGEWLVDVGYPGPSYLEPLLVTDSVQTQYGCQYRLLERDSEVVLQRRGAITRWSVVYSFSMKARQWSDWKDLEDRVRELLSDAGRTDGKEILFGRTFENGQVVMKGRRYLIVRDGREQVRTILDDGEHQMLISHILSGALS